MLHEPDSGAAENSAEDVVSANQFFVCLELLGANFALRHSICIDGVAKTVIYEFGPILLLPLPIISMVCLPVHIRGWVQ